MKCVQIMKSSDFLQHVEMEPDSPAIKALSLAFLDPVKKMAENSGLDWSEVEGTYCTETGEGFDFFNMKKVSLYEKGIIDPFRVTRCSIKNATSVATSLLTTSVSVIEV